MSESPGHGTGDVDINGGKVSARLRPAEDDGGIEAIPAKAVKIMEEEQDDNVALDEEEYDEEEEEDLDGDLELEGDDDDDDVDNNFDETGESSTDLDDFVQENLAYIEDCQTDIDSLNQKANDEILKVEKKYNKLRQPVYSRRNNYIERIQHFWAKVFSNHPQLTRVLTKDDIKCLKFCTNLQIDDFEDSRSGYSIKFRFGPNPYFNNTSITKDYHMPWHESPSCDCTAIDWKPSQDLTRGSSSFFSWFCAQDDASSDDIAEIIREELWPNPLQYYSNKDAEMDSGSDEDSEDESATREDAPVYVGDDTAEYISSEDEEEEEEWKARNRNVQGKEVPSGSKADDFYVIDDDDDVDFEEGLDEVDDVIDPNDVIKLRDEDGDDDFEEDLEDESNDVLAAQDVVAEPSDATEDDVIPIQSDVAQQDNSNSNCDDFVTSSHGVTSLKPVDVDPNVTSSNDASLSNNGTKEDFSHDNEAITSTGDT